jgi:hypothetical protein
MVLTFSSVQSLLVKNTFTEIESRLAGVFSDQCTMFPSGPILIAVRIDADHLGSFLNDDVTFP